MVACGPRTCYCMSEWIVSDGGGGGGGACGLSQGRGPLSAGVAYLGQPTLALNGPLAPFRYATPELAMATPSNMEQVSKFLC